MKYICLIYADEAVQAGQGEELWKAYAAFGDEAGAVGKIVAGDPLESSSTATMVRVRDGQTLTTDGPYAETKEQIGGYYVFECDDLDDAVAWAAKIPSAKTGGVEVRPLAQM